MDQFFAYGCYILRTPEGPLIKPLKKHISSWSFVDEYNAMRLAPVESQPYNNHLILRDFTYMIGLLGVELDTVVMEELQTMKPCNYTVYYCVATTSKKMMVKGIVFENGVILSFVGGTWKILHVPLDDGERLIFLKTFVIASMTSFRNKTEFIQTMTADGQTRQWRRYDDIYQEVETLQPNPLTSFFDCKGLRTGTVETMCENKFVKKGAHGKHYIYKICAKEDVEEGEKKWHFIKIGEILPIPETYIVRVKKACSN